MANRSFKVKLSSGGGGESVCWVRSRPIQTLILNGQNRFVLVELTLPALLLFFSFLFISNMVALKSWLCGGGYGEGVLACLSSLLFANREFSSSSEAIHCSAREPRISSGEWLQSTWYLLRQKSSVKPISYDFRFCSLKKISLF